MVKEQNKKLLKIYRDINNRFPAGRLSAYLNGCFEREQEPNIEYVIKDLNLFTKGLDSDSRYTDKNSIKDAQKFLDLLIGFTEMELEIDETQEDEVFVKYDIASYPSDNTLSGIVDMWNNNDITIPEFQREFVWSIQQSSLLIESFLLGLPVPPVFLYIDHENKNLVVDGQQRILSIVFYFEGYFGYEKIRGKRKVFRLQGLDNRSPYTNKSFKELDEVERRKLRNTVLRAINIRQLNPSGEHTSIYHIFERLNTGGTPLKIQEIRNVVFRGKIVKILRDLNTDINWRKILGKTAYDKHQKDVELVLRVLSLSWNDANYVNPMKEFLNKAMERNRDGKNPQFIKFCELFHKTSSLIVTKLGNKPFHLRGPLNSAVLDSVFCTLLSNYNNIPTNIAERYKSLKSDKTFNELTSYSTTNTLTVRDRFKVVKSFLIGD